MRQEVEHAYCPVVCPRCGSAHFEFITEYHKRIGLRVVSAFLLAVCIMLAVISFMDPDINIPPALIAVFFSLLPHVSNCCMDGGEQNARSRRLP